MSASLQHNDSAVGGDIIDSMLNDLENRLSLMEEREDVRNGNGGKRQEIDDDCQTVNTSASEVEGGLNDTQRKYVREMVTHQMVKQIMARRLERRTVPELMKMSKKLDVDLAPKMKDIVNRLADATASNNDLKKQIQAIAILGGLDDADVPDHAVLYAMAREDIAKRMKHVSIKNLKRAERELEVSLQDCRDGIVDTLCKFEDRAE